ncbi:cobalt-precorrin-5B (C(1))-methyltransferase [Oceanomicrobium pacificus]|uniref:Cobalt-precorrin-5B C(1)-methyltransferase n=1 Tax=Oceanomicrobium pacificus TaxID=2692916 RepID=A0A6B0TXZ7_9RHOB|nr:cobalt-precorrin-5B (C(1))-methyltransferase [Oceanomicrobium pacificus]MXU65934.1 cobalt-precorrin-5B (C(1))-methyltransferase [Oceanomicrobium pacificus]
MTARPHSSLRRGWTTGACATAATRAALADLWGHGVLDPVSITLPGGEMPSFPLVRSARGPGWALAAIEKDAGDDPDVTHGAIIEVEVRNGAPGAGVRFHAGDGVGTVTRPGLPIPPGEAAINPVPRKMMAAEVAALALHTGRSGDIDITISVPGGAALAEKTWNPRLGIVGGISILGTTGIVRPFSCAAWIASIHRGVDVARADRLAHVAGCTGNMSERAVQALYGLPDHAMLDMGDFAGGLIKYLARHPVPRLTIGGGPGKLAKLAQGAMDLHSARSQVDFDALADLARNPLVQDANTVLEAIEIDKDLPERIAEAARQSVHQRLLGEPVAVDVVLVDRQGHILARSGP